MQVRLTGDYNLATDGKHFMNVLNVAVLWVVLCIIRWI